MNQLIIVNDQLLTQKAQLR